MLDAEWDELADSATGLMERFPKGKLDFGMALVCVLLLEVHDQLINIEPQDRDDDEWLRG